MAHTQATQETTMFTLVHLSDIHLPPLPRPKLTELLNKRILGYLNWHRKRIKIHRQDILSSITADIALQKPNHIAITGDLTNIGLKKEFQKARRWAETLGTPDNITIIPGNHDAYVNRSITSGWPELADYMSEDSAPLTPNTPLAKKIEQPVFPFVKIRENIALIGVSSAVKTLPLMASGRLGERQIDDLSNLLQNLKQRNLFRVLLIHHPPLPGLTSWQRELNDAPQLQEMLKTQGPELVLYGHNHSWHTSQLHGQDNTVWLIQAPSASQGPYKDYSLAGYNKFSIDKQGGVWRVTHTRRGLRNIGSDIEDLDKQELLYE